MNEAATYLFVQLEATDKLAYSADKGDPVIIKD